MSPLPDSPSQTLTGKRVLVIDDEPTLQLGVKFALTTEGADVDTTGGGEPGLELVAERKYDLVMVDLRMPVMDGVEFVEKLRATGNQIPVVLMSAHLAAESIVRCARCGVMDFLEKPVSPARLRCAATRALRPADDSFGKLLKAGRQKKWEEANSHLCDLDPARKEAWKDFLALASGSVEPGKTLVGKAGIFPLIVFEGD